MQNICIEFLVLQIRRIYHKNALNIWVEVQINAINAYGESM